MKFLLFSLALLSVCKYISSYNFLLAIPTESKGVHSLFYTLCKCLVERGHQVTVFTSYEPPFRHPNVTHFQPGEYSSVFHSSNFFEFRTQMDIFTWHYQGMTKVIHQIWSTPEVWHLYHERNTFDGFLAPVFGSEHILPFLHDFRGAFVLVCAPGIELHCLSKQSNWVSPAVVSNLMLSFDGDMNFWQRSLNLFSFAFDYVVRTKVLLPSYSSELRKYFEQPVDIYSYYKRADLTLINGHFALDMPIPLLPNQVEIGMINTRKPKPLPQELEEFFEDSGPYGVIYFSLGSFITGKEIPQKQKDVLVETFKQLPQRVLWKYEGDDLPLPANVKTGVWLPQQDILGHPKTRLFISHCGVHGTQEAMYHGVPVLALPVAFDQHRNAYRMERKGYGLSLKWQDLTVEKLVSYIHILTNDTTYRDRMKSLSNVLQDQLETPAERAVWWIEYTIRHKGSSHLRYAGRDLHFLQYIMADVIAFWLGILIAMIAFSLWIIKKVFHIVVKGKKKKE